MFWLYESSMWTFSFATDIVEVRYVTANVLLDRNPELLNYKTRIIDGQIVVVSSSDFTNRAEIDNDENVLIIHSEAIAQKFLEEFQRGQSRAQP